MFSCNVYRLVYSVLFLYSIMFRTTSCDPSIVIIGAGAAGIAAAARLLKNNFTNFVILEAQDRIGGRVNSVQFGDAIVDVGAEWCHGEKNNVVFEMVKDLNVISLRNQDTRASVKAYYSNGKEIPSELNSRLLEIMNAIYPPTDDNDNLKEDVNLGKYCKQEYGRRVSELNISDPIQVRIISDFVDSFEHFVISMEGAFSWFDPSAISDFIASEGRQDWTWSGLGSKTALDVLMQKFPSTSVPLPIDDKFVLNKDVKKIYWDDGSNSVTVACHDNSTYSADFVIFTPSIGVLKEQHKEIFVPGLPDYKINAIEKIGFAAVMKVILQYKNAWWPVSDDFAGFNFIWAEEHKSSTSEQLSGKTWLLAMSALVPVQKNPNVLSMWFVGPSVPFIETLDGDLLLEGIDYALNLFLGHKYTISHPISFIRSSWYTNPRVRGTYSFQTVASRKTKSNVHLSEPLLNKNGKEAVLFAGEATNPIRYSTLHGAIETGYREADRIITLINK